MTFLGGHFSIGRLGSRRWTVVALTALMGIASARTSRATPPLLASPALARQLQQRVTLTWNDQEVAAALARLAEVQRIPIWIDRRVDPHARVSLSGSNLTLVELMERLAANEENDWGWSTLRTVVYFGPRESARDLATLSELARQELAKAPSGMRRAWTTPSAWEFPRLSEPQTLFAAVAAAAASKVRPGTSLPHDLWPAYSLQAVPPIDRAVLILSGFDLQFASSQNGREAGAVRLERPVQLTATYLASAPLQAVVDELAAADSSMAARRQGRRLSVAGRWEVHEQLRRALKPASTSQAAGEVPPQGGEQRYTLRIANKPVGAVLDQLAGQLQLDVVWGQSLIGSSPSARDTLISCEVREADLAGLLEAILAPAGLAYELEGTRVTIGAAN